MHPMKTLLRSTRSIKSKLILGSFAMVFASLTACAAQPNTEKDEKDEKASVSSIAIDHVWSGHRIKPYLLTRGKQQFVAYFDANRQMTVAHREGKAPWRYYKVDSWLGWDSHNYVTMELDSAGNLHVMGNMHADPMEYFRTSEPLNIRSLKRVPIMVDKKLEQRMTYPIFMLNKSGELLVKYRDGGSGNGNEIYNIYDTKTNSWSRLHANQFLDGQGKMSGYFEGPTLGPDGMFHLIWVWRNTPNAATNHSLSYAKSADLVDWSDSQGNKLSLPLTLNNTEVVDPVPPKGGMINGNVKIGFDQNKKPVITYHKYDSNGDTQMYVARLNGKQGWDRVQISDWKGFRWDFSGGGSLGRFAVKPHNPEVLNDKEIGVLVRRNDDVMRFVLDAKTLKTKKVEQANLYPPIIETQSIASNKGLLNGDTLALEHYVLAGKGDNTKSDFYLSFYSQPGNRDRAHSQISPPSVLLLTEVQK